MNPTEQAAAIIIATWFIGTVLACALWSALWSRRTGFSPETEQAIVEALAVAGGRS